MKMRAVKKNIVGIRQVLLLFLFSAVASPSQPAETLEPLIAAAKTERELLFVAGPTTFVGKKGLSDLEAAFNKKCALNRRILFTAAPRMNLLAPCVTTLIKPLIR